MLHGNPDGGLHLVEIGYYRDLLLDHRNVGGNYIINRPRVIRVYVVELAYHAAVLVKVDPYLLQGLQYGRRELAFIPLHHLAPRKRHMPGEGVDIALWPLDEEHGQAFEPLTQYHHHGSVNEVPLMRYFHRGPRPQKPLQFIDCAVLRPVLHVRLNGPLSAQRLLEGPESVLVEEDEVDFLDRSIFFFKIVRNGFRHYPGALLNRKAAYARSYRGKGDRPQR